MIDFYYSPTPNGWKVAIMLEECGVDYRTILMQLHRGDQFKPEFLAISPAGQMPAIVDLDGSEPVAVFESAAILLYLADKTGLFAPPAASMEAGAERRELVQWLFWQAGNQGPAAGNLSHYVNYAPGDQREYGLKRYTNDYKRCLTVLENRLQERDYILGEYSIADMACFPWPFIAKPLGVDLSEYPAVQAWRSDIKQRPAVRRAIDLHKDKQNLGRHTAQNNDVLFNQDGSQLKPGAS